jgi:hypothetical protein
MGSHPDTAVAIDPERGSSPDFAVEVAPDMDSSLAAVEETGSDKKDTPVNSGAVALASDSFPVKEQPVERGYNNSPGVDNSEAAGWDNIPGAGMFADLDKDNSPVTAASVAPDSYRERPLPESWYHCRQHSLGATGFPEFLHMMTLPESHPRLTNNIQLRMTVEGSYQLGKRHTPACMAMQNIKLMR